jgi:DNA polymerase III alpha subunit (gram-positive type)
MRLLGIDFETTGLDGMQDRITEIGISLWDTDPEPRPLVSAGYFFFDPDFPPITEEITRITGITRPMLEEFGLHPKVNLEWLEGFVAKHKVDYLVAHNCENLDKIILKQELLRHGVAHPNLQALAKKWIDTMGDLPLPYKVGNGGLQLKYMASDHGLPPMGKLTHRAMFDVLQMMQIITQYKIEDVLAWRAKPSIIIRAVVPHPRQDNGKGKDLAKAAGFRWQEVDGKTYDLCWVKKIKEDQFEEEKKKLPGYEVVRLS